MIRFLFVIRCIFLPVLGHSHGQAYSIFILCRLSCTCFCLNLIMFLIFRCCLNLCLTLSWCYRRLSLVLFIIRLLLFDFFLLLLVRLSFLIPFLCSGILLSIIFLVFGISSVGSLVCFFRLLIKLMFVVFPQSSKCLIHCICILIRY